MNEKKPFDRRFEESYSAHSGISPSYADEWESTEIESTEIDTEPAQAKIIARMPDLGTGETISGLSMRPTVSPGRPGVSMIVSIWKRGVSGTGIGFAFLSACLVRRDSEGRRRVTTAAMLVLVALVVASVVGGMMIHKNTKRHIARLKANVAIVETSEKPAEKPALEKATEKPAAMPTAPKAEKSEEKPAEPPAIKPAPAPSATAKPIPVKSIEEPAEKPAAPAPVAKAPVIKTPEKADKKAEAPTTTATTAWDRSSADGYTPWTMASAERLEAAQQSETGTAETAATSPAVPTTTPPTQELTVASNQPVPTTSPTATPPAAPTVNPTPQDVPGFSTSRTTPQPAAQPNLPLMPMQPLATASAAASTAPSSVVPPYYVPTHATVPTPQPQYPAQASSPPTQAMSAQPQYAVSPYAAAPATPPYTAPQYTAAVPLAQRAAPQQYYGNPYPQTPPATYSAVQPATHPTLPQPMPSAQPVPYPQNYRQPPQPAAQPSPQASHVPQYGMSQRSVPNTPYPQGTGTIYSRGNTYQYGTNQAGANPQNAYPPVGHHGQGLAGVNDRLRLRGLEYGLIELGQSPQNQSAQSFDGLVPQIGFRARNQIDRARIFFDFREKFRILHRAPSRKPE